VRLLFGQILDIFAPFLTLGDRPGSEAPRLR
jgi:hypothetical protein